MKTHPSSFKPSAFQLVKFGEIAKNISKRVEPSETDLDVYVGLEHLDPQSLRITRRGVPADVKGQKLRVRPGQIIFGKRRAYQKKFAVADFDGICSAHAMVLEEVPGKIIPGLLPFFMQSDMFMDRAVAISEGSLSPTIKWKTLAIQEFPLPPIERQKAILEVLEKVEEVILKGQELLLSTNLLLSSLLHRVYKSEIKNNKNNIHTLQKIAKVTMGASPSSLSYNDTGEGLPLLQGKADLINRKSKPRIFTTQITKECNIGDILLSVRAPVGYVSKSEHKACIGRGIAALNVKTEIDRDYVYYALIAQEQKWKSISQGGIFAAINSNELKNIKIQIPPRDIQKRVAKSLEKTDKFADLLAHKREKQNLLKQNIFKHLFEEKY